MKKVGVVLICLLFMVMLGCEKGEEIKKSKNNYLKKLEVFDSEGKQITLQPEFSNEKLLYEAKITTGANIAIVCETEDTKASYKIEGNLDNLLNDENNIIIRVMAEDGSVKNYTIKITKNNIQSQTVRVHYHRWKEDYAGWTLWTWGDTTWKSAQGWAHGIQKSGSDSFGIYYDIPLKEAAATLGILAVYESDGTKDGGDREISISGGEEIWIIEKIETIFSELPNLEENKLPVLTYSILVKENEFIEIDKTKTKLLFRAAKGAKVEVLLGETKETLTTVFKTLDYNSEPIYLENLTPGKKYFYQIKASKNGESRDSEIIELKRSSEILETKTTSEWAREALFYEIYVRAFYDSNGDGIGDLNGVAEKLDYLKDLGITGIWMMPIFKSTSSHGYDVEDFFTIEPDYGTEADLKNLITKAHEKGIKIILDFPVNHTSRKHPWFGEKSSNIYKDYYVWEQFIDYIPENATEWSVINGARYYSHFGAGMPDLNFRNYFVREKVKEIAKFWIDRGIDGFRLDAAMHIDIDGEVTHNWWQEFNAYCKNINKELYIVGENWTGTTKIAEFFADMDSSFNFPISTSFNAVANGYDIIGAINKNREIYQTYNPDFIDAIFTVNHDSVNNRMASSGLSSEKIKVAAAAFLTAPGTPFIYYGEEIGMKGSKTPDTNLREPMDWYKSANGMGMTRTSDGKVVFLKADDGISFEEENGKESIYELYKKIGNIRTKYSKIFSGEFKTAIGYPANIYAYEVSKNGIDYKLKIIHNYGASDVTIKSVGINIVITNNETVVNDGEDIIIKGYSTTILKQ